MHDYTEETETIQAAVSGELPGTRAHAAGQSTRAVPSPTSMNRAVVTATALVGRGRDEASSARDHGCSSREHTYF